MKAIFPLLAVSLFVGGCADGVEGTGDGIGSAQQAIGWGKLVPATTGAPDTSAVKLEISQAGGARLCSGIKVDANTFWTAGSCIERAVAGDQVRVTNNVEGDLSGSSSYKVEVASVDVHPSRKTYSNTPPLLAKPRHYDVGRLIVKESTPDIPSYSAAHTDWVGPGQSVTYTAYGEDPESHNDEKKQYQFFSLVSSTAFADATPYDQVAADAIYARHMLANPLQKPYSTRGDEGAAVTQKFGTTWKIVGLVPEETPDTKFVRYGAVHAWLASPAVNKFEHGFVGSIFNKRTGRCLQSSSSSLVERECGSNSPSFPFAQSWALRASGTEVGSFQLETSGFLCIEAAFLPQLRTCFSFEPPPSMRWRFVATNHPDYWQLRIGAYCLTASSSSGSDLSMSVCGSTDLQSWIMTR